MTNIVPLLAIATLSCALAAEPPALIPLPVRMEVGTGVFTLSPQTQIICADKAAETSACYLASVLRPATGFDLKARTGARALPGSIFLATSGADAALGTEGYEMTVAPAGVVIRAPRAAGLFYACQTLRQLMPPAILASTNQQGVQWTIPAVRISDSPRYAWRGLMLDVCRHFFPVEFVKRYVDLMALHKMNTLHLHLTDDQGWRIEIKKYPRLTEAGSIRKESPAHGDRNKGDGTPYGPFFYTQQQIRDIVAYAAERHVTVVPEIEMPGHALGALSAYPELSCTGGPFSPRTRWGVEEDVYCAGNDKVIQFNQDVLAEVLALFPGTFIHIGGDECPKSRWNACPKCNARMKDEKLKDANELQSWFVRQIDQFLAGKGRRLIGWDEILEGGLAPGAAVMSWRGVAGGIAAAHQKHDVVMSPNSHCYLDYAQSGAAGEPEAIGGHITLGKVYSYEPTPASLSRDRQAHILGVQGNLWAEYLWEPKDVEYFAFPRACALAEIGWTPADRKNMDEFWSRMHTHTNRLEALKVHYRRLTPDQK